MERKKILDRNIDYKSTIQLEGYDSNIDPKDLSKLFTMLQNPYKNNIGSIVREITSNCFDSHKQAGVDDAVVIQIDKDDSGFFISFNDVGVGLSPEKIKNIYINYLASDKEDNLDVIGAFGIGSKSPLSYQSAFFIDTVYEGVNYNYIMREGEVKPRIEKISETPIDQRNGTKIKIYIKKGNPSYDNNYQGDLGIFIKECKKQLFYLDNVYFDISEVVKSANAIGINSLENNFKIYEGKHFLYREYGTPPFSGLHLSIGKIPYPIDWDQLGIAKIDIPLALKFDIAEIPVIQTREDIRYTDEAKNTIKDKINLLREEIAEMYNNQDFIVSNNHIEFYENVSKAGRLVIDNHYLSITSLYYHTDAEDYFSIHKLMSHSLPMDKQIKPIHIKGLGGSGVRVQDSWSFNANGYELHRKIKWDTGYVTKFGKYDNIHSQIKRLFTTSKLTSIYYINEGDRLNVRVNKYLNSLSPTSDITLLVKGKKSLSLYKNQLNLYNFPKNQWREKIKLYQKYVEEPYEKLFKKYSDVVVTNEWWKKYKKENYTETTKNNNFMYMRLCRFNNDSTKRLFSWGGFSFEDYINSRRQNFDRHSQDQKNASVLYDKIVYGRHEDKTLINVMRDILLNNSDHTDTTEYITVADSRLKLFENVEDYVTINDYIEMNKKEIERILAVHKFLENNEVINLTKITYYQIAFSSIFIPDESEKILNYKERIDEMNRVKSLSPKIYTHLIDSCNYIEQHIQKTDPNFKFNSDQELIDIENELLEIEKITNKVLLVIKNIPAQCNTHDVDLYIYMLNKLNLINNKSILTSLLSIEGVTEDDVTDFSYIIIENIKNKFNKLTQIDQATLEGRGYTTSFDVKKIVASYVNVLVNKTIKI